MVKITTGKHKGKILVATENGVRPTSDKIRQAIFNILSHGAFDFEMRGARVLDAFAGTGALGLEALSRGAAAVWLVEKDRSVFKMLLENAKGFVGDCHCLNVDVLALPQADRPADLVFLDPPYGKDLLPPALLALRDAGWIAEKTLCVCEMDGAENFTPPNGFAILDDRKYGRTRVVFLQAKQ
jgi:16S rRNA (guanine966-N2)-methyltransferase